MRIRKPLRVVSGVPGVNAPKPKNFDEFYAFYLSQHLHPTTRRVHVFGMTLGWLSVAFAALLRRPLLAIGLPLFGYGAAIPSHYIWEKNKPALSYGLMPFVWAIGCDFRQALGYYTGRLTRDINEVRAALHLTPAQITLADAPELSSAA
jgi:hypothetical protein